jgi:hypothetical protein
VVKRFPVARHAVTPARRLELAAAQPPAVALRNVPVEQCRRAGAPQGLSPQVILRIF